MVALAASRAPARWVVTLLGALALSAVLTASAHVTVPFWPVPMTLQPLAVLAIAGLAGPRLAVASFAAYLIQGAIGLPVFAGTPARGIGLSYMVGPTGGYLLGQFAAMALVSALVEKFGRRPLPVAGAMLFGLAVIYACGAAWLSGFVGVDKALSLGVAPFLLGDAVKLAVAVLLVQAVRRARA